MVWRLSLARQALADIDRHRAWLTQEGAGTRALHALNAIVTAINDLPNAPLRWPASPDQPGYRNRIVDGYVIIYRVEPPAADETTSGSIQVLRVFAPGQDRRGRL
jgi:plasmid stabilization system protein ParE